MEDKPMSQNEYDEALKNYIKLVVNPIIKMKNDEIGDDEDEDDEYYIPGNYKDLGY